MDRRAAPKRTWSRSVLLPGIAAVTVVPLAVTAVATLSGVGSRGRIERTLVDRSNEALYDAGVPEAQVRFDGRDATLFRIPTGQELVAARAVASVDGVRVVRVDNGATGGAGTGDTSPKTGPFGVEVGKDSVVLTGSIVDQATKDLVLTAARQEANGRKVVDRLAIGDGAPQGLAPVSAVRLTGAAGAPSEGVQLKLDGTVVELSGKVPTDAEEAAVEQRVRIAAPNATIDNKLTVAAAGSTPAGASNQPDQSLQQQIDAKITAGGGIGFVGDGTDLTPQGRDAVVQIAGLLRGSPDTKVDVGGHVAANGKTEQDAQKLSADRAAVVRDLLVQNGIAAARVTSQGFGASRSIAPNDPAAAQKPGDRIEITVR